jgi:hypothetical protein
MTIRLSQSAPYKNLLLKKAATIEGDICPIVGKNLAGTKASVIQVRAEAKDYLDLDALMRLGEVDLATALSAAHALYGPTFNPEVTLKALSYFDDGNLRDLPNDLRLRLVEAARGSAASGQGGMARISRARIPRADLEEVRRRAREDWRKKYSDRK